MAPQAVTVLGSWMAEYSCYCIQSIAKSPVLLCSVTRGEAEN